MLKRTNSLSVLFFSLVVFFQISVLCPAHGQSMSNSDPLKALNAPIPGVDQESMDAESSVSGAIDEAESYSTSDTLALDAGASGAGSGANPNGPNLDLLWNCKRNPTANKEKCAGMMQFFCAGYCTRLNCAILTNRSICLDVCGASNPMMTPCVAAGKRNTLIQYLPAQPFVSPPVQGYGMSQAMGMNSGMSTPINPTANMAAMTGAAVAQSLGGLFGKK